MQTLWLRFQQPHNLGLRISVFAGNKLTLTDFGAKKLARISNKFTKGSRAGVTAREIELRLEIQGERFVLLPWAYSYFEVVRGV